MFGEGADPKLHLSLIIGATKQWLDDSKAHPMEAFVRWAASNAKILSYRDHVLRGNYRVLNENEFATSVRPAWREAVPTSAHRITPFSYSMLLGSQDGEGFDGDLSATESESEEILPHVRSSSSGSRRSSHGGSSKSAKSPSSSRGSKKTSRHSKKSKSSKKHQKRRHSSTSRSDSGRSSSAPSWTLDEETQLDSIASEVLGTQGGIDSPALWEEIAVALRDRIPSFTKTSTECMKHFRKQNPLSSVASWTIAEEMFLVRNSGPEADWLQISAALKKSDPIECRDRAILLSMQADSNVWDSTADSVLLGVVQSKFEDWKSSPNRRSVLDWDRVASTLNQTGGRNFAPYSCWYRYSALEPTLARSTGRNADEAFPIGLELEAHGPVATSTETAPASVDFKEGDDVSMADA